MKAFYLFLGLLIGLTTGVVGQRQIHRQNLYWIRYQSQVALGPRNYVSAEIDNRRFFSPDVQHQLIIHARLHHKVSDWDFGGGLTTSWAYTSLPENGAVRKPVAEFRPVIEASHEWSKGSAAIQNRLRFDHRFIEDDPEQSVFRSNEYTPRLRYRLQWKRPLLKGADGSTKLSLRISNEVMVNLRRNTFDQNRVYASGDLRVAKNLSLEAGYIYIYQQRLGRNDVFFCRNVMRFSVLH